MKQSCNNVTRVHNCHRKCEVLCWLGQQSHLCQVTVWAKLTGNFYRFLRTISAVLDYPQQLDHPNFGNKKNVMRRSTFIPPKLFSYFLAHSYIDRYRHQLHISNSVVIFQQFKDPDEDSERVTS